MKFKTAINLMGKRGSVAIEDDGTARVVLRECTLVAYRANFCAPDVDGFFVESHLTGHQTYCKNWRRANQVLASRGE